MANGNHKPQRGFGRRNLITLDPMPKEEILDLLDLAKRQKTDPGVYRYSRPLNGKSVGLFFEKASLRTRISFEVAAAQLGCHSLYFGPESGRLGAREPLRDFAKVAARYLDVLIMRTFKHETIVEVARFSEKPVINALSDERHPCQALGDLLTIREKVGHLKGVKLAFVGDANNVCRSLAVAAAKVGAQLTVASPPGYGFSPAFLRRHLSASDGQVRQVEDPVEAVRDADIVYVDVWVSMGQEDTAEERRKVFRSYQLTSELLLSAPKAFVMHCLPAHRGEEVEGQVLDGPRSIIYDQAENRLHAQRALLTRMLG